MNVTQRAERRSQPEAKTGAPVRERLEAGVTPEVKELLQHAASIERHRVIKLTFEDTKRFFAILENPPEPTDYMRKSLQPSRKLIKR